MCANALVRGAGNSKGRTSWQSKAEQNDYISFIGFMIYYLHHLCPPSIQQLQVPLDNMQLDPSLHDLSPIQSQVVPEPYQDYKPRDSTSMIGTTLPTLAKKGPNSNPCLLLAGYSYGALITCSLPPMISSIISPFQTPSSGSPHAEIRLRAQSLASQQNKQLATYVDSLQSQAHSRGGNLLIEDGNASPPKIRRDNGSVRMGGEENLRRTSHESYRSRSSFTFESPVVRRSVDKIRSIGNNGRYSPRVRDSRGSSASLSRKKPSVSDSSIDRVSLDVNDAIKAIPGIVENLQTAYLLVSPLQGWVNTLATMWSNKAAKEKDSIPENELKFTIDPTLALFGDDDVFVSIKKLRSWVERLSSARRRTEVVQFRYREIPGAGHFWHDYESVQILRKEVKDFVSAL